MPFHMTWNVESKLVFGSSKDVIIIMRFFNIILRSTLKMTADLGSENENRKCEKKNFLLSWGKRVHLILLYWISSMSWIAHFLQHIYQKYGNFSFVKHNLHQVGGEHGTSSNNCKDWLSKILVKVLRLSYIVDHLIVQEGGIKSSIFLFSFMSSEHMVVSNILPYIRP